MATRVAWSSLAVLAAAAVLGCGRSAKAAEAARTVRSWEATVRLLQRAEGSGAVPARFARQVREAAAQGLSQAQATLQPPRQRTP
jgi:hypothetical protein